MLTLTELLADLPPEPDEASLFGEIRRAVAESGRKLVVIDDEPTGTRAVHGIEVLTRTGYLVHPIKKGTLRSD